MSRAVPTVPLVAVDRPAELGQLQKMLGHASAAMTLDTYSDLFDDDLEAVATALDRARSRESVGKVWARSGHGAPNQAPDWFADDALRADDYAANLPI